MSESHDSARLAESGAVRGLVVAHSSLGAAFVAAVQQIAGVEEEALQSLSNEGQGPEGLLEAIRRAVGESPAILFVDLSSGSCAFAARRLSMEQGNLGIVSGVNLPLLLDFAFHRHLPLPELVERLVEKGRQGILGACPREVPPKPPVASCPSG